MQIYQPSVWLLLPFVALLATIALAPVLLPKWWLRHYAKVALALAVIPVVAYFFVPDGVATIGHAAHEYFSFISLVGSLFIVSGGIHISVKGEARPVVNVLFLLTGAVISNVIGTTGASMLLIRPWLRMNKFRVTGHHVVFFIFIVSNVGGCLTPIGDPPLFLGFLEGVPFWWVLERCWPMWAVGNGSLLLLFFLVDSANYRRSPAAVRERLTTDEQWKFQGLPNLIFLAVILVAIFIKKPPFVRETLMIAAALGSYFTTKKQIYVANAFNFHPIHEVAVLFVGIFATMMPALDWLKGHSHAFGNLSPGAFFWGSGFLSSVLDNAPTYYAFFGLLQGQVNGVGQVGIDALLQRFPTELVAVSIATVFFGANTYIGNGPNFMVKSIAQHDGVRTPTFTGYILKFTVPFMLPVLVLVWLLFFRH